MVFLRDEAARGAIEEACRAEGIEPLEWREVPVDTGALIRARELEYLASLWIGLAYGASGAPAIGRNFAFRLVRR